MTAGYSGTPLPKKLGIKPGIRAAALHAPKHYTKLLGALDGVRLGSRLGPELDFLHAFFRSASDLESAFPKLEASLAKNGTLWVSWPKTGSAELKRQRSLNSAQNREVRTRIDGNVVRRIGLAHGLVDVKVCAVDDDWSGLKFVRRLRDR
jgi:hypothetical protein